MYSIPIRFGSDRIWSTRSNRLTSVDFDGLDTGYAYLGDDSRLSTTTSAGTTDYLIERQGGLPQVVDDGTNGYLHDVTGNSVAIDDTTTDATYPLADALGSLRRDQGP